MAGGAARLGREPFAPDLARLPFRRRWRWLFDRRQSPRARRAQEYQSYLSSWTTSSAWPDEKADVAHSPLGFKSKTDPTGAIDQPVNPMKKLISAGATFVARSHATQVNHMIEMMERAFDHQGFSVVEILSECVEFSPGVFDPANPAQGRGLQRHPGKEVGQHARG